MIFTPSFPKAHVERIIAVARVVLSVSSLFAVWLDPTEPSRYVELTYGLHSVYVVYSVLLAAFAWRRDSVGIWPFATQVADIAVASVFQYLTLGPSSPFFVYFVFALFSAALRWGARGTIRTAVVVLLAFIVMSAYLSRTLGPAELELNRFVIRIAYLMVVAVLLMYLGQHEERLRDEVRRLARWPLPAGRDLHAAVTQILQHSAGIIGAARAVLIWEKDDEPWRYLASWPADGTPIERHAPADFEPLVPGSLAHSSFAGSGRLRRDAKFQSSQAGVLTTWHGLPVHPDLVSRLDGDGVASTPFVTEHLSGRIFFADVAAATGDPIPLLEVVGREVGASLDQLYSYERSREIAISEDRIRLARDLHDGVLQSLTGMRLELQNLADTVDDPARAQADVPNRLRSIERELAVEQGELRRFIADLKPSESGVATASLADRLEDLRKRIELQWRVQVAVQVRLGRAVVSPLIDRAVPLMVHEAVMNALKHARPSKVIVDVSSSADRLAIAVEDDGQGFPFTGRQDHATLVASNAGPVSLRERVSSLGGTLEIESSSAGSRVELTIPLQAASG